MLIAHLDHVNRIHGDLQGKTTLINQILQTEKGRTSSEPPSTYLLEYKYARQSAMSLVSSYTPTVKILIDKNRNLFRHLLF
jgi:hypothetical protein